MYVFRQFPPDAVINEGIQSTHGGNARMSEYFVHSIIKIIYNICTFVYTLAKKKATMSIPYIYDKK